MGFILTAIGSGGIRPCVAAFGADQIQDNLPGSVDDVHKEPKELSSWSFFNWYYFVMGLSSLLAVTVIVYVQDNVGWGVGFGISAGLMFLSVICFAFGSPLYIKVPPVGSPLTRVARVLVAAFRKRGLFTASYNGPLHEVSDKESGNSQQTRLRHTDEFRFFDRAAILQIPEDHRQDGSLNPWRLCTVTEVEELKLFFRIAPIWASGILLVTASAQQNTFSV
ncbi:hypothetical protein KP509_16G063900 [Ceratopteris richardii]|uniref:Uncharacterized protein n=1 Tax=Ceratopteris richardii TaxID=49495 RepID=A0A8T2T325_CERRI|nr:hypothetical protein KP509_16G063900 [Ceratopteris richardii]